MSNLLTQMEQALAYTLEDTVNGFGKPMVFTDLEGVTYEVAGQYHRIGQEIDPETGLIVAGSKSAVTVRASRFTADNLPDEGWLVQTTDSMGTAIQAKIAYRMRDLTIGMVTCILKR